MPGKPLKLSLMFVGKARSLPKSGALERCFANVVLVLWYSFMAPGACIIKHYHFVINGEWTYFIISKRLLAYTNT